jgi:hypothetical protein
MADIAAKLYRRKVNFLHPPFPEGLSSTEKGEIQSIRKTLEYFRDKGVTKLLVTPFHFGDVYTMYLRSNFDLSFYLDSQGYEIVHPLHSEIIEPFREFHKSINWDDWDTCVIVFQISPASLFGRNGIHLDYIGNTPFKDEDFTLLSCEECVKIYDRFDIVEESDEFANFNSLYFDHYKNEDALHHGYNTEEINSYRNLDLSFILPYYLPHDISEEIKPLDHNYNDVDFNSNNYIVTIHPLYSVLCYNNAKGSYINYSDKITSVNRGLKLEFDVREIQIDISTNIEGGIHRATNFLNRYYYEDPSTQGVLIHPVNLSFSPTSYQPKNVVHGMVIRNAVSNSIAYGRYFKHSKNWYISRKSKNDTKVINRTLTLINECSRQIFATTFSSPGPTSSYKEAIQKWRRLTN